jgi:hypothetical protein
MLAERKSECPSHAGNSLGRIHMEDVNEKRDIGVRNFLRLLIPLFLLVCATYALSVSEPTKVILLGGGFIGTGIWGRRLLKLPRKS